MVKDEGGEPAPPPGDGSSLQIKIRSQEGDSIEFKVKPSTKFKKIFDVYAQKKGIDIASVRFLFEGANIAPDSTVGEVEMIDGDSIDVMATQTGGR